MCAMHIHCVNKCWYALKYVWQSRYFSCMYWQIEIGNGVEYIIRKGAHLFVMQANNKQFYVTNKIWRIYSLYATHSHARRNALFDEQYILKTEIYLRMLPTYRMMFWWDLRQFIYVKEIQISSWTTSMDFCIITLNNLVRKSGALFYITVSSSSCMHNENSHLRLGIGWLDFSLQVWMRMEKFLNIIPLNN